MILEEVSELIKTKDKLSFFNTFNNILRITGSVAGSFIGSMGGTTISTIIGNHIGRGLAKAISSIYYNKLFNELLFTKHVDFIHEYFIYLNELEQSSNTIMKKELKKLNEQFEMCLNSTHLISNIDRQYYELRTCHLKYLNKKSAFLQQSIDREKYKKFQEIFKELLPIEENFIAPIGNVFPMQFDAYFPKIKRNYTISYRYNKLK